MSALYLETSAVLAWLFGEPAGSTVLEAIGGAEVLLTSVLTVTESERAIYRAVSARRIKEASASRRFGPLTVYLFDYDIARHILPPAT